MAAQIDHITRALQDLTLTGVIPLDEELGRGAYEKVFKVKYGSIICAAKEIHSLLAEADEKRRIKDSFLRECYHCSSLRHPNIVRFIGVYYQERDSLLPVMLMELMDDSLTNYVKKPNISVKRKASILYDVSLGLSYLHGYDPPIIHRDLSPNNILMSRDSVAKISDLGVANYKWSKVTAKLQRVCSPRLQVQWISCHWKHSKIIRYMGLVWTYSPMVV